MYNEIPSNKFRRSLKRIQKHPHYDEKALIQVIQLLKEGALLEARYKDHELKGKYIGIRELHLKPDDLLLYVKIQNEKITLMAIGSHSEIF